MSHESTRVLNDDDFAEFVTRDEPVLVDFAADWCPPCRQLGPTIDALADDAEGFAVAKVNVDRAPRTAAAYGIQSLPTVLVLRNGEVVERLVGLHDRGTYERAVASAL